MLWSLFQSEELLNAMQDLGESYAEIDIMELVEPLNTVQSQLLANGEPLVDIDAQEKDTFEELTKSEVEDEVGPNAEAVSIEENVESVEENFESMNENVESIGEVSVSEIVDESTGNAVIESNADAVETAEEVWELSG